MQQQLRIQLNVPFITSIFRDAARILPFPRSTCWEQYPTLPNSLCNGLLPSRGMRSRQMCPQVAYPALPCPLSPGGERKSVRRGPGPFIPKTVRGNYRGFRQQRGSSPFFLFAYLSCICYLGELPFQLFSSLQPLLFPPRCSLKHNAIRNEMRYDASRSGNSSIIGTHNTPQEKILHSRVLRWTLECLYNNQLSLPLRPKGNDWLLQNDNMLSQECSIRDVGTHTIGRLLPVCFFSSVFSSSRLQLDPGICSSSPESSLT